MYTATLEKSNISSDTENDYEAKSMYTSADLLKIAAMALPLIPKYDGKAIQFSSSCY